MKQQIVIAKVAGRAVPDTIALFQRIQANVAGTAIADEHARFSSWLSGVATGPPVLFHCQYLDMWSSGDLIDRYVTGGLETHILRTTSPTIECTCYSLPDNGVLLRSLDQVVESARLQHDEDRWFVQQLRDAITAWQHLVHVSLIIIVRFVLGPTVTDEEVKRALL